MVELTRIWGVKADKRYPTICEQCKWVLSFMSEGMGNTKLLICANCKKCFGRYYVYQKGEYDIINKLED